MMDNGSRRPHVVTKGAYDLLCEPLCASDLRDLHELLSKPSVKKYFANTFGAESEMDVDWTKKVWAPYVEFLTGRNEKGEDIPDKPGVFFSSCSSWVANFDPEICADAPETRPEELWKRSLKDLPLRGNIVMLYLNWGGDLSRKRSADDNGDWTGLYGSEKESKSQRSVAWRNFHTKKEVTQWRDPHSRFSAMAAGPIAGAYWTDFYKFIPTPDQSSLNNFLKFAKNEKIYDELEKLMLTLFDHELERLDGNAHPTPSQESHDFNRLILATTDSYDILRSHDLSKYGFKPLKPWCLIRWPHHSPSNAGLFKATALAYAYGRVERALEYAEGASHKWSWPFGAYLGSESAVEFRGSSHSLLEWFKKGFPEDWHEGAVDFDKSGVLHCYKRYSALVEKKNAEGETLLKSKDAIVADAKKALAEYRAADAIDAVKSVMYKDGSKPSAEDYDQFFRVEVERSQAFRRLKPSKGRNGNPGKSLEQKQVEFVVFKALHWKDLVAEDDVNAAFLLGWRSEDKLMPFFKDGEWHVPDAFDETSLMPAPKDLVSVKKELKGYRPHLYPKTPDRSFRMRTLYRHDRE